VVDFLKNPDKYTALGAKIPKGALLVGSHATDGCCLWQLACGEGACGARALRR
jgi:cell division protease FtsH